MQPIPANPEAVNKPRFSLRGPHLAPVLESRVMCLLVPTIFAIPGGLYLMGVSIWACPMSKLGVDCPGCGLTRSFEAGLHGRFEQMLAYHPLAPAMALLFAVLIAAGLLPEKLRRPLINATARIESFVSPLILLLIGFIVLFILRLTGVHVIPD